MAGIDVKLVLSCLIVCVVVQKVWSLQCYQCTNMDASSKNGILEDMFSGKSDPHCESPLLFDDVKQVECQAGFRCGSVKTITTAHVPLLGDVVINTLSRDCLPASFDGCDHSTSKLLQIMGELLSFAAEIVNFDVKGGVCYCSTDNCLATWCQDGNVEIGGYCVAWYFIAAGVGGSILFLLLITCCCCCCCRCCRSKPTPVFTTITVPHPVTVMSTSTSSGIHGVSNQGYTRFHNEVEMHQPEAMA